ncbi:MAG: gamma-glutamyltransferase [Candidatus Aminicenantes bacterium]|jgi:gamma-glutamyltranspeptidase/glutathione hydrolase
MSKRVWFLILISSLFLISTFFACRGEYSPGQNEKEVIGEIRDRSAVSAEKGMVVSADEYASRIGVDILKKGGNAVDAAVAVGFALAVTYPSAGNIGGGGFMIICFPDEREPVALDFREMAPGKAAADMYLDAKGHYVKERSFYGHLAVGVPGTVRGFELASHRYGVLEWKDVLAPAIELAEKGFELTERRARSFNYARDKFPQGTEEFKKIFTKENGSLFKKGDLFDNNELALSLKLIANQGADAFYDGEIAKKIAENMERNSGLITKKDLKNYNAVERTPVSGTYKGFRIISMPPPSSGGTILIEMLNILEGFELGQMERFSPKTLHLIAETMKFAYLDRAKYMGDADFGNIPVDRLISKAHAKDIRTKIHPDKALPSLELGKEILTLEEAKETTHYSVVDKDGLAVATTYTLNGGYGAGVVVPGTGILLNNEMDDFNVTPGFTDTEGLIGTEPNLIHPYKRMLSSMTPTIVEREGQVYLITGSPGGRTIINTVLNVVINVLEFKMDIQKAVDAPRIDHEWMPDVLNVERKRIRDDVIYALRSMGHTFKSSSRLWSQGDAHSIFVDPQTGIYYGAADKRSEGAAIGF